MSNPNVLGLLAKGRAAFTTHAWRDFLIGSIGQEPNALDMRAKMVLLLRIAPFVERYLQPGGARAARPGQEPGPTESLSHGGCHGGTGNRQHLFGGGLV
ncbi:MAG: BREX system Lon protease-like protein BrxL [Synechococcaceae cyanobacterium]